MPSFQHDGATIYYEELGQGFPILAFAPQGLLSTIAAWETTPLDPRTGLASDFRVIVMDQRNAGGRSHAPVTAQDGWQSYARDQIALLDHLGIDRCHLLGQCIGGPFIFSLLKAQPQRFAAAVIAQPIGRDGPLKSERPLERFTKWSHMVRRDQPGVTDQAFKAFFENLYGPDFVYSVDREFVSQCATPSLLLFGNDESHPLAVSQEVARLMPNAETIAEWKTGTALEAAKSRIKAFLKEHTPD